MDYFAGLDVSVKETTLAPIAAAPPPSCPGRYTFRFIGANPSTPPPPLCGPKSSTPLINHLVAIESATPGHCTSLRRPTGWHVPARSSAAR
jgi:hypothetical protein